MLETERLIIQPYSNSFLEEYYKEFTDEITKYQYPDSFSNINTANEIVSGFVKDMEQGNMLELVILTQEGEFIGSMEAFGIKEKTFAIPISRPFGPILHSIIMSGALKGFLRRR